MILNKIRLYPFAGIADSEINFKNGLNVILGPNETGKSTIFHAIQNVLFTKSNLKKKEFEKVMQKFIPILGDTAQVELYFNNSTSNFILYKRWGGTSSAKLSFPDGTILTDNDKIYQTLIKILPAREGTFKSILMTNQSSLSNTLNQLKSDYPETILALNDILLKSIFTSDGISIDKFKHIVQKKYKEYFSHWDRLRECPEKNRGISNPFKKEVGEILYAFYKKEEKKRDLEKVEQYELKLDKLNSKIAEYDQKINEKEDFIKKNDKLVQDIRERSILESRLTIVNRDITDYKKIMDKWPLLEKQISDNKKLLPELTKRVKDLVQEQQNARLAEKNKNLNQKYERAKKLRTGLDEILQSLNKLPKLSAVELNKIRKAEIEIKNLKTEIEASHLAVKLLAKKEFSIQIQRDFENTTEDRLSQNSSITIDANGIIRLEHPEWSMEITSGTGDFNKTSSKLKDAQQNLKNLLDKYNLTTLYEAIRLNEQFEKTKSDLENAKKNLKMELGNIGFEQLEADIKNLSLQLKPSRSMEEITKELTRTENEIEKHSDNIKEFEKIIKEYKSQYNNRETLLDKLIESKNNYNELNSKISQLQPIPKNIANLKAFVLKFEQTKKDIAGYKNLKNNALIKKVKTISDMPDISAEELKRLLNDAEEHFNMERQRGNAIYKIMELTEKLLENVDKNMFTSLERDISNYIGEITENRYTEVTVNQGIPGEFIRNDGKNFNYNLLSTGTQDVHALAIRLAMAGYFLNNTNGFLLMDDPLVDIDHERQKKSAEIIKKFARQKQMLIFTCHPSHAELIGGNIIELKERI